MNDTRTVRIIIEIPIRKDENVSMPGAVPQTVVAPREETDEEKAVKEIVDIRTVDPKAILDSMRENMPASHEVSIGEDGSITDLPPSPAVPGSSTEPTKPIEPEHFNDVIE